MQISYVFKKQDTWEICMRCFLDADDGALTAMLDLSSLN
jgi:hypothetical protein